MLAGRAFARNRVHGKHACDGEHLASREQVGHRVRPAISHEGLRVGRFRQGVGRVLTCAVHQRGAAACAVGVVGHVLRTVGIKRSDFTDGTGAVRLVVDAVHIQGRGRASDGIGRCRVQQGFAHVGRNRHFVHTLSGCGHGCEVRRGRAGRADMVPDVRIQRVAVAVDHVGEGNHCGLDIPLRIVLHRQRQVLGRELPRDVLLLVDGDRGVRFFDVLVDAGCAISSVELHRLADGYRIADLHELFLVFTVDVVRHRQVVFELHKGFLGNDARGNQGVSHECVSRSGLGVALGAAYLLVSVLGVFGHAHLRNRLLSSGGPTLDGLYGGRSVGLRRGGLRLHLGLKLKNRPCLGNR